MQLLNNISKYLVFVLLSCSLVMVWDGANNDISDWHFSTPQETSTEITPAKSDSIWNTMRDEFQLDHQTQSARVQAEIRKLLADQDKLNQILQAATPYIYFIHQQTQAYGLPAELALIPFVESEFNPNDHSKKGATGLWQLMSGTAHELGVKIKSGYDGRRDVIASTHAALAYFRDLGNDFKGNWYLAIAAYNCGQGKVQSVTRRAGTNSFWNLNKLPRETKLYVPKLLAVAAIIKNPEKYGVQLPQVENQPYFTQLTFKNYTDLPKVSKTSGVSMDTLRTLNPDYKYGIVAKKNGYTVLVPVDKARAQTNTVTV